MTTTFAAYAFTSRADAPSPDALVSIAADAMPNGVVSVAAVASSDAQAFGADPVLLIEAVSMEGAARAAQAFTAAAGGGWNYWSVRAA